MCGKISAYVLRLVACVGVSIHLTTLIFLRTIFVATKPFLIFKVNVNYGLFSVVEEGKLLFLSCREGVGVSEFQFLFYVVVVRQIEQISFFLFCLLANPGDVQMMYKSSQLVYLSVGILFCFNLNLYFLLLLPA